jgi:hypothetical protein
MGKSEGEGWVEEYTVWYVVKVLAPWVAVLAYGVWMVQHIVRGEIAYRRRMRARQARWDAAWKDWQARERASRDRCLDEMAAELEAWRATQGAGGQPGPVAAGADGVDGSH